ncbi:efflux RND transporter permease subunit [Pseudomonas aeruginosa]|nr:efflux RND transporter permease subunit [Pseudomonas aeruginosa]
MSLSTPFIRRPVATTLLTLALLLAGTLSFGLLPVAPLPNVDFPAIVVSASLPGAKVQAAINGAMSLLPSGMPNNPSYRKANPSDMPIMVLTLTSETQSRGEMYDLASTVLAPKLSQVQGVGQVSIGGSSLPAVRVDLNPDAMSQYGLSLDSVRTAIAAANSNGPKGAVEKDDKHWQVDANDQLRKAREYEPLVIHYNADNGAAVRLGDVAKVSDSVEDVRNAGFSDDLPAVLLIVTRQPGANIIEATDAIHAQLPVLQELLGPQVKLNVMDDRSPSIRASLEEAELTLLISVALVILVVFLFLRNGRATLIPSLAVPVSLIGTFAVMYLCDFSLNNLSLMALIIATGFVVDDAIVVVENIARRIEEGDPPIQAAITGARQVGFTVLSMTLSLVAVFIPLLLMGGLTGRLFREFAVTLSAAILVSLVVSLTLTPMLCARLLRPLKRPEGASLARRSDRFFAAFMLRYRASLGWALEHSRLMVVIMLACIAMNLLLFVVVPKGFLPQQDSGRLRGYAVADQNRAATLGINVEMVDAVLNDSFGQRQVSTIFNPLNQYRVVMEVDQQYQQSPEILRQVQVIGNDGQRVPLSAFSHYEPSRAPLEVNHQGQFAATTLSFNLAPGAQIGPTREAIMQALEPLHIPVDVQTSFEGNAGAVQDTQNQMPWLILLALLAVYIVLGILYESYVHPLTILSTLPSAGVGALLALILCRSELSLIALIGIILLIGIVKKNAIMMIDFALEAERNHGLSPREAILEACMMRFRPIMMTTLAALLGALPLIFGIGGDAALRRPLGITIVGGLIGSQLLTLYTTPVVYLYLDRLRHWVNQKRGVRTDGALETPL